MDYSTNDSTVYHDFSSTKNNDSDIIVLDHDENGDQYLVSHFKIMCLFELDIERV